MRWGGGFRTAQFQLLTGHLPFSVNSHHFASLPVNMDEWCVLEQLIKIAIRNDIELNSICHQISTTYKSSFLSTTDAIVVLLMTYFHIPAHTHTHTCKTWKKRKRRRSKYILCGRFFSLDFHRLLFNASRFPTPLQDSIFFLSNSYDPIFILNAECNSTLYCLLYQKSQIFSSEWVVVVVKWQNEHNMLQCAVDLAWHLSQSHFVFNMTSTSIICISFVLFCVWDKNEKKKRTKFLLISQQENVECVKRSRK